MVNSQIELGKPTEIWLSNDAFFYILSGEEPLDEDNLAEAEEVLSYFPNGFDIVEWHYEETDMVAATFIGTPNRGNILATEAPQFDAIEELVPGYTMGISLAQANTRVMVWAIKSGRLNPEVLYRGEFDLAINSKGMVGYQMDRCLFWLKHYKELRPGALKDIPKKALPAIKFV